jgi:hypothetical protein
MPVYLSPGVYIEEVPSRARPIEGVATSVAAFIGRAPRGTAGEAKRITKLDDYRTEYGEIADEHDHMGFAVQAFYQNGGKTAYICRLVGVGSAAAAAGDILVGEGTGGTPTTEPVFRVSARNEGEWGNNLFIRLVKPDSDTLALTLEIGHQEEGKFVVDEAFAGLTMRPADDTHAPIVVNSESNLVTLALGPAADPDNAAQQFQPATLRGGELDGAVADNFSGAGFGVEILSINLNGRGAVANNITVLVGSPGTVDTASNEHQVNLFFYRFEPSGFQAAAHPNDVWRLRLFCLITPFGVDETENGTTIGAGENELRMMGEIIRLFHEVPILAPLDVQDETVRMQAIYMPLTDEQLNQIWSTQGDMAYRPSAVYEFSLAPIVPSERRSLPPLAGLLGVEARAAGGRHTALTGILAGPRVPTVSIDISNPGWRPALAWVLGGELHRSLAFEDGSPALVAFNPVAIWLAGDPDVTVELTWERWTPTGWVPLGAPIPAQPYGPVIDPGAIPNEPSNFPLTTPLPVTSLDPGEASTQLLLHARRSFTSFSGGPVETVRSEPLLITIYGAGQ